jgi:prephenate dehydratase
MRVAIQGELGSFHHLAAKGWYEEEPEIVACQTFEAVFDAVTSGKADQAVVAIENSLYGSINQVYDLLARHHLPIIGEISERIHQQLIGLPGAELSGINAVMSHPVALGQCSEFLTGELPKAERVEYYDTAAAVQYLQQNADMKLAAIGSTLAAEQAGLAIIRKNVENDPNNYTRFVVVSPGGQSPSDANKSSLVIQTSHQPAALYRALGIFADGGINLTKLQSRPIPGKVWRYQFYVDAETAGAPLKDIIRRLKKQDCSVTVLGEYRADSTEYEIN